MKKTLEPEDLLNLRLEHFQGEVRRGQKVVSPRVSWSTAVKALNLDRNVKQKELCLFEMARVGSGLEWAVILDQFVDATNHRLSLPRTIQPGQALLIWTSPPVDKDSLIVSLHIQAESVSPARPKIWVAEPDGPFAEDWLHASKKGRSVIGSGKLGWAEEQPENRCAIWRAIRPRSRILIEIKAADGPPVVIKHVRLLALLQ